MPCNLMTPRRAPCLRNATTCRQIVAGLGGRVYYDIIAEFIRISTISLGVRFFQRCLLFIVVPEGVAKGFLFGYCGFCLVAINAGSFRMLQYP